MIEICHLERWEVWWVDPESFCGSEPGSSGSDTGTAGQRAQCTLAVRAQHCRSGLHDWYFAMCLEHPWTPIRIRKSSLVALKRHPPPGRRVCSPESEKLRFIPPARLRPSTPKWCSYSRRDPKRLNLAHGSPNHEYGIVQHVKCTEGAPTTVRHACHCARGQPHWC